MSRRTEAQVLEGLRREIDTISLATIEFDKKELAACAAFYTARAAGDDGAAFRILDGAGLTMVDLLLYRAKHFEAPSP